LINRGCDRIVHVVEFTTTYAITAYHHQKFSSLIKVKEKMEVTRLVDDKEDLFYKG
jgi:hypothetical protein